jgi:glycosyltransferase involved in cell wall biosynthesis
MPELVSGFHRRLYARLMYKIAAKKSSYILTISKFTQSELIKLLSIDEFKIGYSHLGISDEWWENDETTLSNNITKSVMPYILYVGNVKPHKNLVRLISAYSNITDDFPHKLIIVGKYDGFLSGDSEALELATVLEGKVIFTGSINDDELRAYMDNADLFVFPSLYEGFGLPPLEAMARGCPVAISDIPVLREACEESAVYFDPYNVSDISNILVRLLSNKDMRKMYSERGLRQARKYNWEKSINMTIVAIDRLLFA